jgi:hypothetical protein
MPGNNCRLHDGAGMRSLLDDGAAEKATVTLISMLPG